MRTGAAVSSPPSGRRLRELLVFMQLGFMGALTSTVGLPYAALDADILIQAPDANTLTDGSPLPRQRMLDALSVSGVARPPNSDGKLEWRSADGSARSLDVMGVDPRLPSLHHWTADAICSPCRGPPSSTEQRGTCRRRCSQRLTPARHSARVSGNEASPCTAASPSAAASAAMAGW